ncbi:hypothetical protein PGH12_06910 [Chryseobacterium wangxinyae]|uniref:hypothetical protein n=1 Tax=Chryseobacterium sp. CY350 TaxID=2997336 RepID=UPI00226DE5F1|nr:hypothetical protein [Chryseobacterium sp. CY350]MCY0976881.1 hypothetical protein [Chryseobacterium sp. CY350]WBZ96880.1 hypothetical protein PGH12_06910 [Chryseobacterium sp. CY350]
MKQVERLRKLINENLYESKSDIQKRFGSPTKKSEHSIWFYRNFKLSPINYETIFIFEEDIVVDICIYEYFLAIEVKNIFYFEGKNPEFKEISFY